jgi:hypothetical protein
LSAAPLSFSGSYSLTLTNAPVNHSGSFLLDGNAETVPGSSATVSERLVFESPDSVWFIMTLSNSGPLANNISAFWQFQLTNLTLNEPSYWDNFYMFWSVDGTPVNPIYPFGGGALGYVGTNPVDAGLDPVYGGTPFPGGPVLTGLTNANLVFSNPYSFISAGGMDPNTVNGVTLGLRFTAAQSAIPEPGTASLAALALAGIAAARIGRRKA